MIKLKKYHKCIEWAYNWIEKYVMKLKYIKNKRVLCLSCVKFLIDFGLKNDNFVVPSQNINYD